MTGAFINHTLGFKRHIFQWNTIVIELLVVATILLLFTSCAQRQRSLPPISPIDLRTEKSIPVGETIIFGRVNVVSNDKPIIWDEPLWYGFHLYLISDSGSEPIVYTLFQDGTFSWHLPPGHYKITGFRWSRGRHYLIRPIFASFSVSKQLEPAYIGELVINFIQTGPPAYSQKIWKLPREISGIYVVDNYQHALNKQLIKTLGTKRDVTKRLMQIEKNQ